VDKNRRKFLKIILVGVGAFFVGKVLDPFFSKSTNNSSARKEAIKGKAPVFRVVENNKLLSIYDDSGEEVFQIDKEV
jgi:hypothetical protein